MAGAARPRVDTSGVRSAVAAVLIVLALAVVFVSPGAAAPTGATLRVSTAARLTLVGTGFGPRAVIRVQLVGPGLTKRTTVRTSPGGGFVLRFAGLERCSIDSATAITATGARVRVPTAFFVRECPPPPPLAPGVYLSD